MTMAAVIGVPPAPIFGEGAMVRKLDRRRPVIAAKFGNRGFHLPAAVGALLLFLFFSPMSLGWAAQEEVSTDYDRFPTVARFDLASATGQRAAVSSADLPANDTLGGILRCDLTITGLVNFRYGTGFLDGNGFAYFMFAANESAWRNAA